MKGVVRGVTRSQDPFYQKVIKIYQIKAKTKPDFQTEPKFWFFSFMRVLRGHKLGQKCMFFRENSWTFVLGKKSYKNKKNKNFSSVCHFLWVLALIWYIKITFWKNRSWDLRTPSTLFIHYHYIPIKPVDILNLQPRKVWRS